MEWTKGKMHANVPCAHIAAPTRLDTVKISPTMGRLSSRDAAKPNTV